MPPAEVGQYLKPVNNLTEKNTHRDNHRPASCRMVTVPRKKSENFDFEQSLTQLETIVERMEQGDLSLEESLAAFQQGIELTRACQKALTEAEQKVAILLQQNGEPQPFEPETGE